MSAEKLSPEIEEKIDGVCQSYAQWQMRRASINPISPNTYDAARDSLRDAIREIQKDSERLAWMIQQGVYVAGHFTVCTSIRGGYVLAGSQSDTARGAIDNAIQFAAARSSTPEKGSAGGSE